MEKQPCCFVMLCIQSMLGSRRLYTPGLKSKCLIVLYEFQDTLLNVFILFFEVLCIFFKDASANKTKQIFVYLCSI
jgi:hypothetical protein